MFASIQKTNVDLQVRLRDNPVYIDNDLDCERLGGCIEWKEAKLIVLGNGQVGKTTLIRNLTGVLHKVFFRLTTKSTKFICCNRNPTLTSLIQIPPKGWMLLLLISGEEK